MVAAEDRGQCRVAEEVLRRLHEYSVGRQEAEKPLQTSCLGSGLFCYFAKRDGRLCEVVWDVKVNRAGSAAQCAAHRQDIQSNPTMAQRRWRFQFRSAGANSDAEARFADIRS